MMPSTINSLPPLDPERRCANVIIETPKGSSVKYAYDHQSGLFAVSKIMPQGMMFPFNFGFIPGTLSGDGDPLDILLLDEEILISGCLVKVQPIGILNALQSEGDKKVRNDRVIGQVMPREEPLKPRFFKLDPTLINQIELFFSTYNQIYGKTFKVTGTGGKTKAWEAIHESIKGRK